MQLEAKEHAALDPGSVPVARQMARDAMALQVSDLPAAVVEKIKILLLDFFACCFEAGDLPWSRQAFAVSVPVREGAAIVGQARRASPESAAFVNATMGHGLVREDMHAGSISHHGVVVLPTLLALAETRGRSGAAFLAAAAVGYEAGARIGRALFNAELASLYRPTGIVAPIGASLAGSHLLGLDERVASRAMGVAANTSSGLNQWPYAGGSEMYFHPGFAARNAITAIVLAEAGAEASEDIIEGRSGVFAAFRRAPMTTPITMFPGGDFEVMAVYAKPAPACNFAQTACQAALEVATHLKAPSSAIDQISVRVPEAAYRYPGCDARGPYGNILQAKMSIQYGVAAVLVSGALAEANYQRIDNPEVLRLVDLIDLQVDPAFTAAFPGAQGAEVAITLADGSRISRSLKDVVPATPADVRTRFRAAAAEVVGETAAHQVEDFIDDLENRSDLRPLGTLLSGPGGA